MPTSRNGARAPSATFVKTWGDRDSLKGRTLYCHLISDNALLRQHLEWELVKGPIQDSQIPNWLKATAFFGHDEVRAVKPGLHLGWRDRLDCVLRQ